MGVQQALILESVLYFFLLRLLLLPDSSVLTFDHQVEGESLLNGIHAMINVATLQ